MQGSFLDFYTKNNGLTIFRYILKLNNNELNLYKKIKGEHYREFNNLPLYFTPFYSDKKITLKKSKFKDIIYIQDDDFRRNKAIFKQININIFDVLYKKSKDTNWLLSKQNETIYRLRLAHHDEKNLEKFDNYNGTYAQDIESYSDDEIELIFGGDPDMYWNID